MPRPIARAAARNALEQFARRRGLQLDTLRSPSRERDLAAERRAAMRHLRELGCTVEHVGELLDRDHSTVSYHLTRSAAE